MLMGLWSYSSSATVYSSFLDNGAWTAKSSVFECSLIHAVPFYGDAVFETRAGENAGFYLQGDSSRFKPGEASLVSRAPVWAEVQQKAELARISITQKPKAVQLSSSAAERMLAELYKGQELMIARNPLNGAEDPAQVVITTVGFRSAYEQYLSCLAGLLPANFDQIKRTSIYFGSSHYETIQPSELRKLDHIIAYVKADTSVREFFIDGHTDSAGSRETNLTLAQKRADEVTNYLIKKGIPKEVITSRWHGERYPVASNETPEGRAKNRRVTIRLEKIELKK